MYNGKEWNEDLGLDWYDYGARWYDPSIGRWNAVDPLAENRAWVAPYNYVQNNPVLRIDPTGAIDNPIYDNEGNFLGTDEKGLQGDAIIMDRRHFTQGMSHNEAMAFNLGTSVMSKGAQAKMSNHFSGLKDRPDYDGFVTINEGIAWAKVHPNVINNATTSDALYINSGTLNFGSLSVDNIELEEGEKGNVNLFDFANFASSSSRSTTYALGNTQIQLLNAKTGEIKLFSDFYDWDFHNYPSSRQQEGKLPESQRDKLIYYERIRAGVNDSHGFPIFMYGVGKIKTGSK